MLYCFTVMVLSSLSGCCVMFQSILYPDGTLLAVGSRDNIIYMYNVTEGGRKYSRTGKLTVSSIRYWCSLPLLYSGPCILRASLGI